MGLSTASAVDHRINTIKTPIDETGLSQYRFRSRP